MNERRDPARQTGIPAPQEPYRIAQQKAVESLRGQSDAQVEWLGAEKTGSKWRMPVLDDAVLVDAETGEVRADGQDVRPGWLILVLHYLDVRTRPAAQPPEVTFASFPSARTYASVYENRVNRRLCATAGRDLETLKSAVTRIGAQEVDGGDVAIDVTVLPRIPIRLIWYAADEELPSSCTLLLPANIEQFLCIEDIVVLSESFVSRLSGRPF